MKRIFIKALSVIMALVLIFSTATVVLADEEATTLPQLLNEAESTTQEATEQNKNNDEATSTTVSQEEAQKTLEEQRAELEGKLEEANAKLSEYEEDAKLCQEYVDTLDEKIGYINEELTLLDGEIAGAQQKIDELKPQIETLSKELKALQKEYNEAKSELDSLNESFKVTYDAYCLRLRAMYISGSDSIIIALLTSKDLSQLFSRYAMIKAIAKSDTALLKEVNEKIDEITTRQDGLNEKTAKLETKKKTLDDKQADYDKQISTIELKQKTIASKKVELSELRAESDALLAELTAKTQMYTEFRNEDQALIDAVNQEISDLVNGLKAPEEVTTAVQGEQTTSAQGVIGSNDSELYCNSNAVLNLTYPIPSYHGVSASFGYYSNGRPHSGTDYPCPIGSKVVAAQKGIVITVKRLDYSYGYYVMIYHGTDAQGRKIVTLYAHNSSILVSVGQSVKKGQQIAKSGSTGNSTGPHCHFELIIDGTKVDAKNYLS